MPLDGYAEVLVQARLEVRVGRCEACPRVSEHGEEVGDVSSGDRLGIAEGLKVQFGSGVR
jgi:hypothetical protein